MDAKETRATSGRRERRAEPGPGVHEGQHVLWTAMDFLIYGRAAANAEDQLDTPELDEAHWSYMDTFAGRMTARGPTLSADRQTWTGSLHVVDLPDAQAARDFAVHDPYHRAGMFTEHLIRRFDNLLGRTMWDFTPGSDDVPFLVIAEGHGDVRWPGNEEAPPAPALAKRLVVRGTLRPAPTRRPSGVVLAVLAPDREAVDALLDAAPGLLGGHRRPEIQAWEVGGRR